MSLFGRPVSTLLLLGALVAALGLAACGRKGPLDPPPASAVPADGVRPSNIGSEQAPEPGPPKRHLPIDWLLN